MALTNVWLVGYGGPVSGATAVWLAPNDGTVPSATQVTLVGWEGPVTGATPIWIAGYGGPPPAAIGAIPVCISGWGGSGGGAPAHSAEALAYLARTVGGNEGGNGANITTLIDGLVSDGVWAKLDALYVLAQQNATDARLNLIGASFPLTGAGRLVNVAPLALAFTSYVGFSGFANGLDTGFNPAIATSPKFIQNSASFGVWAYSAALDGAGQIGSNDAGSSGESHIYDNLAGNFYVRLNAPGTPAVASPGTPGLYVGDRSSSASLVPYYNGIAKTTQTATSQAPYSGTFKIGQGGSGTGVSGQTLSAVFIGASLGVAGQLALYNRLKTYMDAVSPPATSVWSSSDATANGMTLSNGGLTVTPQGGTAWGTIRGSTGKTSGKLYFELSNSAVTSGSLNELYGVASSGFNPVDYLGNNNYSTGVWPDSPNSFASTGFTKNFTYASSLKAAQNDVYAFAVDFTAGAIWMARNNVWDNSITPTLSKILPLISFTPATVGALFPAISFNATGGGNLGVWTLQSAAASQKYAPPSGFTPWG